MKGINVTSDQAVFLLPFNRDAVIQFEDGNEISVNFLRHTLKM